MKIRETQTSRESQFGQLVYKYLPKATSMSRYGSGSGLGFHVPNGQHMITVRRIGRKDLLFNDGEWMDIELYVYSEQAFEAAISIAREYSDLTSQTADIVKEF